MGTPIANLRGPLHVTAVELYRGHHGDAAGLCVRCGARVPCPVRQHAGRVIAAAGDDPRWYDGGGMLPPAPVGPSGQGRPGAATLEPARSEPPPHSGYAMAGRMVRMDPSDLLYERER